MKIAQISDIHITPDGAKLRDVDVRHQFCLVLDQVKQCQPDLVVLSGDLASENGEHEEASYQWIAEQCSGLNLLVLNGNHDDPNFIRKYFGHAGVQAGGIYGVVSQNDRHVVFLDTGRGVVDLDQLGWYRETTSVFDQFIVFLHYPPVVMPFPFMEKKHRLQNRREVWQTLVDGKKPVAVFCGHYHNSYECAVDGIPVFLAPSTMLQIGDQSENYNVESTHPGWRLIEWQDNALHSKVIWCDA